MQRQRRGAAGPVEHPVAYEVRRHVDPRARWVYDQLRERGHVALFVGACVSDMGTGRKPRDFDVTTSATPKELLQIFTERAKPITEIRSVLLTVIDIDGYRVDVTSLSEEPIDRSDPGLVEELLRADAKKRDIALAALYLNLDRCVVFDWVGGWQDLLKDKCVRLIGDPDQRIVDDPVRILRAAMLAARYRFEITHATRQAMRRHAPLLAESDIYGNRVSDKLSHMWVGGYAVGASRILCEVGVFDILLPEYRQSERQRAALRYLDARAAAQFTEDAVHAWLVFLIDYLGGEMSFHRSTADLMAALLPIERNLRLSRADAVRIATAVSTYRAYREEGLKPGTPQLTRAWQELDAARTYIQEVLEGRPAPKLSR